MNEEKPDPQSIPKVRARQLATDCAVHFWNMNIDNGQPPVVGAKDMGRIIESYLRQVEFQAE